MNKEVFHVKLHKRIAQSSVGASAIRNQGKKGDGGLIEICRNYFETQIKLTELFSSIESSNKFKRFLDLHTNKILALFPETAKSWGAARKGLNLFIRDITYNKYFADEFKLPIDFNLNNEKLKHLEIPLDKYVANCLYEEFKKELPRWKSIKGLTPELSERYQEYAKKLADDKNIARVHLDLLFWRMDK